ncbi:MAG: bifunctional riboflavin kinase/FAD synthetase [Candidatus Omnitrophica bacterium]|nr:bifunctional riboflavin kinase/FAD synthetase [Candidatus Omnitrophota bacterium]
MRLISNLGKTKYHFRRPAVAIGIFDGMHRGHQLILKRTVQFARAHKTKSIVITFFPHPAQEESILSLEHRIKLIESFGIDFCVVIQFTKKFSQIKAEEFVKNILAKQFAPQAVFVGENFTFGRHAEGNAKMLRYLANQYNFKLFSIPMVKAGERVISSTSIRSLIKNGSISKAQRLLGRPVSVLGRVIKGSGRGRLWHVPTANINPHHEVLPKEGIYAVKINFGAKILKGVCYIGHVSILKNNPKRIEVHIFNFHREIYGWNLEIIFVKRIRSSLRFHCKEALIEQIRKDIQKAKQIFKQQ